MIARAVGRLDPRVRLILYTLSAVTASLLSTWPTLILSAGTALLMLAGMGVPLASLMRRVAWIGWLMAGICLTVLLGPGDPPGDAWAAFPGPGADLAGRTAVRMLACFLGALVLAESTPLPQLLGAMEALKVPRLFVLIIGLAARYISVLRQEAAAMTVSRKSRCYRPARNLWDRRTLRTAGQTIGMLLLRAHARSERIYWAMMARGFSLQSNAQCPSPLKKSEKWLVALSSAVSTGVFILDWQLRGL